MGWRSTAIVHPDGFPATCGRSRWRRRSPTSSWASSRRLWRSNDRPGSPPDWRFKHSPAETGDRSGHQNRCTCRSNRTARARSPGTGRWSIGPKAAARFAGSDTAVRSRRRARRQRNRWPGFRRRTGWRGFPDVPAASSGTSLLKTSCRLGSPGLPGPYTPTVADVDGDRSMEAVWLVQREYGNSIGLRPQNRFASRWRYTVVPSLGTNGVPVVRPPCIPDRPDRAGGLPANIYLMEAAGSRQRNEVMLRHLTAETALCAGAGSGGLGEGELGLVG